ncbi:MAG: 16S rRNA (guanine(527)-N(7))-methyltransferase RsmG [Deltaproteobacteria bacterium]|nr:16S rRNA (guanine(527)-N(7))-methyltransferase RsmG [Deltaproteobacteria bacterium]
MKKSSTGSLSQPGEGQSEGDPESALFTHAKNAIDQEQTRMRREGAQQFALTLSEETVSQFATFIAEIQRWSTIADLLSQTDPATLIRKHILDSLALLPWIPQGSRVLDLGSGAGFPGLPLAIAAPGISVTLIEARRKRANFLKASIRTLGLRNVNAYEGRAEHLSHEDTLQAAFDIIVTRATWSIALFLTLARPFLRPDGIVMAMKGPKLQQELEELRDDIEKTGFSHTDTKAYTLAGNAQRNIAFFSRTSVPKKLLINL